MTRSQIRRAAYALMVFVTASGCGKSECDVMKFPNDVVELCDRAGDCYEGVIPKTCQPPKNRRGWWNDIDAHNTVNSDGTFDMLQSDWRTRPMMCGAIRYLDWDGNWHVYLGPWKHRPAGHNGDGR